MHRTTNSCQCTTFLLSVRAVTALMYHWKIDYVEHACYSNYVASNLCLQKVLPSDWKQSALEHKNHP